MNRGQQYRMLWLLSVSRETIGPVNVDLMTIEPWWNNYYHASNLFIQEKIENIVCTMAGVLFRPEIVDKDWNRIIEQDKIADRESIACCVYRPFCN